VAISANNRRRVGLLFGIVAIAALSTVLLRKRNEGILGLAGQRTAQARQLFAGAYIRERVELGCEALAPAQVGGPEGLAVVVRVADHLRLSLVGQRCASGECMPIVTHAEVDYRLPGLSEQHDLHEILDTLAAGAFAVPYADDGAGPHVGHDDFEAQVAAGPGEGCISLRRETTLSVAGELLTLERVVRSSEPAERCVPVTEDAACRLRVVEHFRRQPRPLDAGVGEEP